MNEKRIPPPSEIIDHVDRVEKRIGSHSSEEMGRYDQLEGRLDRIEASMRDMLEIWHGARGVLIILKWAGYIATGTAAFIVWAKDHVKW